MKKALKNILDKHKMLIVFSILSFLLLIIFITFQYFEFSGLDLDVRWIIVSGIPILIGLLIGEYIKSFKGFGVEIESSLKAELPSNLISQISEESIVDVNSIYKSSLEYLHNLSFEDIQKISRLRFVFDKRDYYNTHVVREYFQKLRNLKYLEVVDHEGKFKFLIPTSQFSANNDFLSSKIESFIREIETRNLSSSFPGAIVSFVKQDDTLLEAYKKLLSKTKKIETIGDKKLPVLDSNHRLIGLLSKMKVEEFISKEVLENYNNKYFR